MTTKTKKDAITSIAALKKAKRGDVVKAAGGDTGIFVGRDAGGVYWVAWDEGSFEQMCAAFDGRAGAGGKKASAPAAPVRREEGRPGEPLNDERMAEEIRASARRVGETMFGQATAFISDVHADLRARGITSMDLASWKALLPGLHRRSLVRIARLDLVEAHDPQKVRKSLTLDRGEERHLIKVDV